MTHQKDEEHMPEHTDRVEKDGGQKPPAHFGQDRRKQERRKEERRVISSD